MAEDLSYEVKREGVKDLYSALYEPNAGRWCNTSARTAGPRQDDYWVCTRPKDHSGPHVAHWSDQRTIGWWGADREFRWAADDARQSYATILADLGLTELSGGLRGGPDG